MNLNCLKTRWQLVSELYFYYNVIPYVETIVFQPLPSISNCTAYQIFIKFSMQILYRKS